MQEKLSASTRLRFNDKINMTPDSRSASGNSNFYSNIKFSYVFSTNSLFFN